MSVTPSDEPQQLGASMQRGSVKELDSEEMECLQQLRLTVRVVTSEAEWLEMREQWNELLDDSIYPNIFLSWEWQTVWWRWFGNGRKLMILLVEEGNRFVGAVPLYQSRDGLLGLTWCTSLYFIGYGGPLCSEYLGPIIRNGYLQNVCVAFVNHLFDGLDAWDTIFLEEHALDDPGTVTFVDMLKERVHSVIKQGDPRCYVSLHSTYNEYLSRLSQHNRKRKRDRFRQASKRRGAQLVILGANHIDHWLKVITDLSSKSRSRSGERSPFARTDYAGFHRDVLSALMPAGHAEVSLLLYDCEPAAFLYFLKYQRKYYAYQTGCDEAMLGSPGDVSFQMAFMLAIENNATEFDLLRGSQEYKQAYTDLSRQTQTVFAFRRAGMNYTVRWLIERLLRPAKHRIGRILRWNTQ